MASFYLSRFPPPRLLLYKDASINCENCCSAADKLLELQHSSSLYRTTTRTYRRASQWSSNLENTSNRRNSICSDLHAVLLQACDSYHAPSLMIVGLLEKAQARNTMLLNNRRRFLRGLRGMVTTKRWITRAFWITANQRLRN